MASPGGDRAGLQDKEAAAVERPLNIQWLAIEVLNLHTDAGKFSSLRRAERRPGAPVCRHRFLVRAFGGAHGHHVLLTDNLFSNLSAGPVNHECIGSDLPSDDSLTQSPGSVDHYLAALSGQWIGSEENACRLGGHHFLHNHRQAHILRRNAMPGAVANGPGSPERSPAAFNRIQHHHLAVPVEIRLLLAGK